MEADLLELETEHNCKSDAGSIAFTTQGLAGVLARKVEKLVAVLEAEVIDLVRLRQCLNEGVPDEAATIREYVWKLVLGYLPPERNSWQSTIDKQRQTYFGLVQMFLPPQKFQNHPIQLKRGHPRYQQLEEDYLLWEQIEKDTARTHAEISFFVGDSPPILLPFLTSARRQKFKLIYGEDEEAYKNFMGSLQQQRKTYRYDYMTRILFVWSKLNPRVQYVQGMNQILAPLFYLVNVGKPGSEIDEAACFFMFNAAISDTLELHIKDLDRSEQGIYGKMGQVNDMLVVIEPLIWSRLQALKIDPFFYCFRWVTLLFAQEFPLFDTIRIWQAIFSAPDRLQFVNFLAIAIIMSSRNIILNSEFTVILEHLQTLRDHLPLEQTLNIAQTLYLEFNGRDFKEPAQSTRYALAKKQQQRQRQEQRERQIEEEEAQGNTMGAFFKRVGGMMDKFFE